MSLLGVHFSKETEPYLSYFLSCVSKQRKTELQRLTGHCPLRIVLADRENYIKTTHKSLFVTQNFPVLYTNLAL